jgi:maltose O-acetyltransferase
MGNKRVIKLGELKPPIYKRLFWNFVNFFAWYLPWKKLRVFNHRLKGVKIGKHVEIGYMVFIDNRRPNMITIEDHATVTSMCNILAHDLSMRYIDGTETIGEVKISKGAFIGMNSTIMPGVTIGENCIIGCGSVVTKDTEANSVYAGAPAKKIKDLEVST